MTRRRVVQSPFEFDSSVQRDEEGRNVEFRDREVRGNVPGLVDCPEEESRDESYEVGETVCRNEEFD